MLPTISHFLRKYIFKAKPRKNWMVAFAFLAGATTFFVFKNEISSPVEYSAPVVDVSTFKLNPVVQKPAHIPTPEPLKGIYMTSWVAGEKDWRNNLIKMIDETELNAIVIDVKDYTGRISFEVSDPILKEIGAEERRIPDIREFIEELHGKDIYAIARISVFQDSYFVKKRPDLAVKRKNGQAWKDYKGIAWLNPASVEVWDYTIKIAKEAEAAGFDELNFDYIRYPSDGNMKDIVLPYADGTTTKADSLRKFFEYLEKELRLLEIPLSADLFGMTTSNDDDLNIGQILEYAAPYFDYICPMVYPSHYPPTFQGFKNPASHPYEIVLFALQKGSAKLLIASSTPSKLRPWLQDFDLGATYDASMVRKQKQAVYDSGLTSWLLWDPSNKYTRQALDSSENRP